MKITKQFTNRESKSLDKYFQEIGKETLLTAEEEIELAKKIRDGDNIAAERMVKANLRFVVSVAKQYQNQGLPLGDLINEGNLGLIKAAKKFDETRGFKFISYAVWWIRQSILQAIAEQSRMVRLPLNQVGTLNKLNKAYNKLEQEFERKPSITEIANELEMEPSDVNQSLKFYRRHVSMDAPVKKDDDKHVLKDLIKNDQQPSPDTNLMQESLRNEVENVLTSLNDREADVLKLYFGIEGERPATLEEIGERFNLTRERVRQIKEKAIRSLRHSARTRGLRIYLG